MNAAAQQIRDELPPELLEPITGDELLAGYRDMFGIGDGPGHGKNDGESGEGDNPQDADSLTRRTSGATPSSGCFARPRPTTG